MLFGGGLMWVFWLIVFVVIAFSIKQFINGANRKEEQDALALLKQRYAKGEIDEVEYQKRKATLEE